MAIPLATTTITITRPVETPGADPLDTTPVETQIASGIRAVISVPTSATLRLPGGDRVVYNARLTCDQADVEVGDTVTDALTSQVWSVMWVQPSVKFVSHTIAGLRLVTGAV